MGYEMYLILEQGEVLVTDSLLKVRELEVSFKTDAGLTKVLDKVDFDILPAEIKGLVGESGCCRGVESWREKRCIQCDYYRFL